MPLQTIPATPAPSLSLPRVLVLDDEEGIRSAISRHLRRQGSAVDAVGTGEDALAALGTAKYSVLICDIRLPGMDGLEALARALRIDPDLAVVMLTGVNDAATATEALTLGALNYLTKPFSLTDLDTAIVEAARKRREAMERRRVDEWIREEVTLRTAELEREKAALRNLSVGVVEALVNAMEARDVYLRGQSQRVASIAVQIAAELGLPDETVEQIRMAGRLQDVGRIGVREAVLNKRETLTDAEIEHIRDHVRISIEILAPLTHLGDVIGFVADHHEHWDGGGYPRAAAGEEISIGGRVLAAADTFTALTSARPYRAPMSAETAVCYMETLSGASLDPVVYRALARVVLRKVAANAATGATDDPQEPLAFSA